MYRDNTKTMRKTQFSNYFHLETASSQTKTWRIPTPQKKSTSKWAMAGTEMPPVALIGGANQAPVTPKWTNLPMEKSILEGQTVSLQSKFDKKKVTQEIGQVSTLCNKSHRQIYHFKLTFLGVKKSSEPQDSDSIRDAKKQLNV